MQTNTTKRRVKRKDNPAPYEIKACLRRARQAPGAHRTSAQVAQTPWRNEVKHLPAARTSPFYVGRGYQQQIDWTDGKRAALSRIKTAKELVAGQAHELPAVPAKKGAMSAGYYQIGTRRGDVGRKKLRGAS